MNIEILSETGIAGSCTEVGTNNGVLHTEWVGLTDKQIDDIMRPLTQNQPYSWRLFARAIEAKLKEKNR